MKLVIENLTKTYKNGVKAIDNLSIEIGTGMFGLLGPNGAPFGPNRPNIPVPISILKLSIAFTPFLYVFVKFSITSFIFLVLL